MGWREPEDGGRAVCWSAAPARNGRRPGEETARPPLRRTASLPGQPQLRTARGARNRTRERGAQPDAFDVPKGTASCRCRARGISTGCPHGHRAGRASPPRFIRQKLSRVEPRSKPRPAKHFRRIPRQFGGSLASGRMTVQGSNRRGSGDGVEEAVRGWRGENAVPARD